MPIALVDYGAGNLTSVRKAFHHLGADIFTPGAPADLERATAIVVPGVGHFSATRSLTPDWHAAIRNGLGAGKPLLGICVGMQWLYEGSAEAPDCPGLGAIKGQCQTLERWSRSLEGAARRVEHAATSQVNHVARGN